MSENLNYREVRGVVATVNGAKCVYLSDEHTFIKLWHSAGDTPKLTPAEARCLARDLRRLARRIDARRQEPKG